MENHYIIYQAHLILSAIMVGIIWVVQLVHYPSFHFIDKRTFIQFGKFHMNKISIIIIPVMPLELVTGFLLVLKDKDPLLILSQVMLLAIWSFTVLFFIKTHSQLQEGYDETIVNRMVKLNWLRTGLWTGKLGLLILYFFK